MAVSRYDVIVVGAGISGVTTGYRLQTEMSSYSYTILEARAAMGGTWDFFKYPGLRSDSDLHTFGFPFRPWKDPKSIALGSDIAAYIEDTAKHYGIDKKIQYHHKLEAANWNSAKQRWELTIDNEGLRKQFEARFVILSTGYYDYKAPMEAKIEGIDNFKGTVVHPQFWPEDLDYKDKKVVVIGSGATAVTLLPTLTRKAEKVTMLQRSPTYLMSLPNRESFARKHLPTEVAYRLDRYYFLTVPYLFFRFCRAYPNAARKLLRAQTSAQLPKSIPHDPHFEPKYNPWEQRLCVCPDGDFFAALRSGKGSIATGTIKTMSEDTIFLNDGQQIPADLIVTATGLKIMLAGGAAISVDGEAIDIGSKFLWKGIMVQDVPNLISVMGYTNASWTLGADVTAQLATRIMTYMKKNGRSSLVPRLKNPESMKALPALNLNSTYVANAKELLPQTGDKGPWKARDNYFADYMDAKFGSIVNGVEYTSQAKL